ncbi:MAG: bifunctional 2-polyprenyl-6-hydroxyphenol methylase/3-demethylubiquinol 3-O-methyltransferase UbiG [Alphaproteobacteria bacterium]|nr:bifunctional 2-polyprenyl-6-hydroxyphenol methylase/3-demethylubiquinol 3-O-methyltransferase UbiG [Alphaproteobacteria bacterium]
MANSPIASGPSENPAAPSVDPAEIARFAAMAEQWWDPNGKFRPLHRLNPTRIGYIRDRLCERLGRDPKGARPLKGLRLLDIGCGGGLLAEPMCRLGAEVVGVDAAERNIAVARLHAGQMELPIDYRHGSAEALAGQGETFDVILNMEVVEHVADLPGFVDACARMLRPGGVMFVATLNRTLKSYALAIVGAEYVLRWLPRGTHDWRKFVRPHELAACCRQSGLRLDEFRGVSYDPFGDRWLVTRDLDVNYMAITSKV